MKQPKERPTSVYIFAAGEFVKIGVAVDPARRLKGVNTGTPITATLYRTREFDASLVAHNIESRMHRHFAHARANGEWFRVAPEVAWEVLRRMKAHKLRDPRARHDTVERWDFTDEDRRITDVLTEGMPMPPPMGS